MNKQELIDKYVLELNGKLRNQKDLYIYGGKVDFYYPGGYFETMDLCTTDEFTQRAKELGFINGYQWGKEYPTNGKKPDLDDGVLVQYIGGISQEWKKPDIVKNWAWDISRSFRIVDERYKPKETPMPEQNTEQDNSWFERGELPPVGVECEAKLNGEWTPVFIVGKNYAGYLVFEPASEWDATYDSYGNDALNFRPIKSERERFVEAGIEIAGGIVDTEPFLKELFDSGKFKLVEDENRSA